MAAPLAGRVAVVTGAGRGIGAGVAMALASAGADVALVSRSRAELDAVAGRVRGVGVRALPIVADVAEEDDAESLVHAAVAELGRLDVLVNNAGIVRIREALEHDAAAWDETMSVNGRGVFLCSRAAAREMVRAGRGGRIVMISSFYAEGAHAGHLAYCASKAAVEAMTRVLALELAPHGITVNSVLPGYVPTALVSEERSREVIARLSAQRVAEPRVPLGRRGTPADVGAAVAFFASDAAAWVTGAGLHVDGGSHLRVG